MRIRDPEAESDGEEVAVEAAVPSEVRCFPLCLHFSSNENARDRFCSSISSI